MKKICIFLCLIFVVSACAVSSGCKGDTARSLYDITCTLDGNVLKGCQTVEFYNHSDNTVSELKFNLFANAFRKDAKYSPISAQYISKAYPNGINYGDMVINSVVDDDGEIEYTIGGEDQNVLCVPLGEEVFPEERATVTIDFTVNLANVIARTGVNSKTVNLANFYPILCALTDGGFYECVYYSYGDPFYSDCADYSVTITTKSDMIIAASAAVDSAISGGDTITRTYKLENARSFAMVASTEFETLTDNSTGVQINYYYYDDSEPLKSMEFAIKSMSEFSDKFGKYCYPTYSVVQTPFVQGGMEFPALVMISDDLDGLSYGEVIVHETAHQWWQTAVGNNEIEYGFLDEGLSEYSVVMFYEKYPEYNMTRENLVAASEKTYKTFCSVYDKLYGKVNTVMVRSLKDFSSEYEYVNIAYIKPCIMYDNLRRSIGDEKFFKALKKYYADYKYKNATPDDLVGAFEKTGADTNGYFESFYNGKVII